MKKMYQKNWQRIQFGSCAKLNPRKLADAEFYNAFYSEFYKKYNVIVSI